MLSLICYSVHIFSLAITFFCLIRNPQHFVVRRSVIYCAIALFFFAAGEGLKDFAIIFDLYTFDKSVFFPFTTIYHLYFFLLLVSSLIGLNKKTIYTLLFVLLAFVYFDFVRKQVVHSYFYVTFLITILSLIYFKKLVSSTSFEKMFPTSLIVLGYLIFSSTLVPITAFYDFIVKSNSTFPSLDDNSYSLMLFVTLTPWLIFYLLLTVGTYLFLKEAKVE